jgi:hypothetical protein
MPMTKAPTEAQIATELRSLEMRRRAAAETAAATPNASPSREITPSDFDRGSTLEPMSTEQIVAGIEALRANYLNYDDELIALKEKRLAAALAADGLQLPPISDDLRHRILMARQLRGR